MYISIAYTYYWHGFVYLRFITLYFSPHVHLTIPMYMILLVITVWRFRLRILPIPFQLLHWAASLYSFWWKSLPPQAHALRHLLSFRPHHPMEDVMKPSKELPLLLKFASEQEQLAKSRLDYIWYIFLPRINSIENNVAVYIFNSFFFLFLVIWKTHL